MAHTHAHPHTHNTLGTQLDRDELKYLEQVQNQPKGLRQGN
jgi:hypothetical protein